MGEVERSLRRQYLIAACLYLSQLCVGYSMGWTAPVLPKLLKLEDSPLDRVITDGEVSWVVSSTFIGLIVGPYISGYLANTVGRKPCLYFGGVMFVLAYIMMALAKSLALIYIARVLVGVGTGVLMVSTLVYIGELASTRIRGTLLTLTGLSNTLGILLVYSVGPFVSYAVINWIAAALNAGYLVAVFFFVPETAVYHVMKGRREEAMALLTSLGRQDDIDEILERANEKPKPKMAQLTEMYTVKTNRKAAFLIISLNVLGQFCGMMTVIAFITVIFEMTGSNMEAHISTIVVGATQVFASVIAPVFVDRIGRKILLLLSTGICALSLVCLGTYFHLYNTGHPLAEDLKWLSLVSVMIFCIAYYGGIGIIPGTFIGEMFTDTCRGIGGTITMTMGFIFGFGVTTSFGYLLPLWGPSVIFFIFSGASLFTFFFIIVFVPETKGKSLLEIQEILSR